MLLYTVVIVVEVREDSNEWHESIVQFDLHVSMDWLDF